MYLVTYYTIHPTHNHFLIRFHFLSDFFAHNKNCMSTGKKVRYLTMTTARITSWALIKWWKYQAYMSIGSYDFLYHFFMSTAWTFYDTPVTELFRFEYALKCSQQAYLSSIYIYSSIFNILKNSNKILTVSLFLGIKSDMLEDYSSWNNPVTFIIVWVLKKSSVSLWNTSILSILKRVWKYVIYKKLSIRAKDFA